MNGELKRLCDEDQCDMTDLPPNRVERDRERRKRVLEILNEGGATEGIDYTHAAVIFQHGEALDDWWMAHKLAYKASELGFPRAKWLSAVALDRWLLRQGKPTKFGTQYVNLGGIITKLFVDQILIIVLTFKKLNAVKWEVNYFNALQRAPFAEKE